MNDPMHTNGGDLAGSGEMDPEPGFRITEVTLAGFGVYAQPTQFLFPQGSAVFWGANERGKTTFLWGVLAVWFGLPGSSDPSRFGTARFRSFSNPEAFWGEVAWDRDGGRFRLRREFDSHRVILREETDGVLRVLYAGEHNPQGRSSAGTEFPRLLQAHLGIADLALFQETFSLAQQLPDPEAIGEELQHLLSGSGSGKIADVQNRLFGQIKELTRLTGDLGLVRPGTSRPTNQRDLGRIESLEARLATARVDLKNGRAVLEDLNRSAEGHEQRHQELADVRRRIREHKVNLDRLSRWMEAHRDRQNRGERLSSLQAAKHEIENAQLERRRLERSLEEEYSDYAFAPAELPEFLERIERADEQCARAQDDWDEHGRRRREKEAEASRLEERLESELVSVRGRTDWVEVQQRLRTAVDTQKLRAAEIERLAGEVEALEEELAAERSLDSVEAARAHARLLLQTLERIESIRRRIAEIESQAEERDFLLSEERMRALREVLALESALRECSITLREQKAAVTLAADQVREAEARTEQRELDRAADLIESSDSRGSALRFERVRPWAAVGASLLLGLGLVAGLGAPIWAGVLATLLAFVAIAVLNRFLPEASSPEVETATAPVRRTAARTSAGSATTEAATDAPASPTAPLTPDAAREELRQAEILLQNLREEEREIESRLEQLRHELGPYANTTAAELAKMEERWTLLDQQLESLRWERTNLLEDRFGVAEEDWRELPVQEADESLERLLWLPDAPGEESTMGELMDWLASRDDDYWDRLLENERGRKRRRGELERLKLRREHLETEREADASVATLEDELRPFDLDTDPEELARLSSDRQSAEARLRTVREQLAELSASPPPEPATVEAVRTEAWEALVAVWPVDRPSGESLSAWARRCREAVRPAREARQRHEWLAESEAQILRSVDVESLTQLKHRIAEELSALGVTVQAIETMESEEGIFASLHGEPSPSERGLRIQNLRTREEDALAEDREREEELQEVLQKMLEEHATLEGRETPNLAALGIRIAEMETDLAQARKEREALVQAFGWVEEAAEGFQSTYRENLQEAMERYFRELTDDPGRSLRLNERFDIEVRDAGGHVLTIEQLSQGARDQLLLSIRLGVADLLSGDIPLPFFFDDPFVHFDERRLAALRRTLATVSRTRQWILLTHRRDLMEWAEPIFSQPIVESETADTTASTRVRSA